MEGAVLEADGDGVFAALAGAKLPEVLRRFGSDVGKQLKYDASHWGATNRDVEKDDRIAGMLQLGLYLTPGRHVRDCFVSPVVDPDPGTVPLVTRSSSCGLPIGEKRSQVSFAAYKHRMH